MLKKCDEFRLVFYGKAILLKYIREIDEMGLAYWVKGWVLHSQNGPAYLLQVN